MFTSSKILEGLFESRIKVKLIKIFLRNKDHYFTLDEIILKTKEDPSSVRYQLKKLVEVDLVKSILTTKLSESGDGAQKPHDKIFTKPRRFFVTNKSFEFLSDLERIFFKSIAVNKDMLLEKLKTIGKIKLVLISGVFINKTGTRIDLLVVGDGIQERPLAELVANIEEELGQEVRFSALETHEFYYRMDMFDNFLRTVLAEPSEVLIDTLGVKTSVINTQEIQH